MHDYRIYDKRYSPIHDVFILTHVTRTKIVPLPGVSRTLVRQRSRMASVSAESDASWEACSGTIERGLCGIGLGRQGGSSYYAALHRGLDVVLYSHD